MTKRIVSVLLAVVLTIGVLPMELCTTAWAEEPKPTAQRESTELLDGYLYQLAGMDITDYRGSTNGIVTKPKYSAGDNLTPSERQVYNAMKPEIIKVANGQRSGTRFSVPTSLSASSVRRVVTALMVDLPYEMYWFGKALSGSFASSGYTISLKVAQDFRGSNEYTTNIPNVPNAVRVAKSVVSSNSGKGDYEKLEAYKDYICAHNTYNYAAASGGSAQYGENPWQLLWVFDNDPNTNVICEGYSKAFKYLCDLTKEQYGWYGSVEARLILGSAGGPHMWNTVSFQGGNYLVDVTNCDGGFDLFMRGSISQTAGSSYWIGDIYYTLDDDTKSVYTRAELTLSSADCPGAPRQITGIRAILPTNDDVAIGVFWNADSRATSYTVYRRESGSAQWQVLKSGITNTVYRDTDVEPGVTYYYTVEGVNGAYRSPTKDETGVSATIPIKSPDDVTLTGATADSSGITVTWQTARYAKTYVVYRKSAGMKKWEKLNSFATGTSYKDTAVVPGATYTYTVRGLAADGKTLSAGYDHTGVTAVASKEPENVTLTSARITGSGITVTWQPALNAKTYTVYRKTAGTGWSVIAKGVTATSYTDNTTAVGETYTYTVRGRTADGIQSKGFDKNGVTATVPKAADDVVLTAARISGRKIVVTWQPADGACSYMVYRKVTGTKKWTAIAKNVKGTSYTDSTVKAGVSYTYTVRGRGGDGVLSRHYDGVGVTAGIPANVTLVSATVEGTGITVTWQKAANAQTYTVYRKTPGAKKWTAIGKAIKGTQYRDAAVTPGTTYAYTVRGVASDGRSLSPSYDGKGVSATVNTTPANVTLTAARAGADGITVTWCAANGAASYTVYRRIGTAKWTIIANGVTETSYTDSKAQAGVAYDYTVRGRAASGTLSPGFDRTGVSSGIPADVTLTAARAGADSITITWQAAANATSYAVYRKSSGEGEWSCLAASVPGTRYVDTTAARDVDYVYTVRGVRDSALSLGCDENGKTAGLYSVPDDVVLTGADANRHGVMITWQPAAYAQSYRVYRRVDGGKWEVLADRVSSTGYCDETFEQGQAYYYTVRALNRTKISRGYDRVGVTATTYYFGTCGDNLSWDMDPEEGMLTIFNTEHGTPCRMTDYDDASPAPWYAAREKVRTVGMYIDQDCALTIGTNAFAGCTALKRIDMLPAGLTAIGKGAFTGCTALTDVYYGDDGHAWEQVTGSENALPAQTKLHTERNLYESGTLSNGLRWELALTEKSGLLTIKGSGAMPDFPNGARTTDWYPYRDKVTVAIVSQGITSVGANAFRDSAALDLMSIAGSVTSVGDNAFRGCSALRKIKFRGKGVDWDAAIAGADTGIPSTTVVEYLNGAYDSGSCGEDLTWTLSPDGVLTISGTGSMPDYSMKYANTTDYTWISTAPWAAHADRIQRLVMEEGVTSASKYAFCGLTALTAVTLPDSLSTIGWGAFEDCSGLTGITIPSGVTAIGYSAFEDCTGLTSITLPDSVTSLDSSVFWGCSSLTSVTLPTGLTSISGYLFIRCTSLTSITIPGGVTAIGASAFEGCKALTAIDLPSGVTAISDSTFEGCEKLTSVTIPSGVTAIGTSAFEGCKALTAIDLPSGVTAISDSTFRDCQKLTSITLPARLKTVGASAFEGCKALTAIDLPDSLTALGASAFKSCSALRRAGIGRLTDISDSLFEGCAALETVSSGTFKTVGQRAFYGCAALAFPADSYGTDKLTYVQTIGANAFTGCKGLTSVKFNNLTALGEGVFADSGLRVADLRYTSITAIPKQAFQNCPLLVAMLGEDVTAIEQSAFSGCTQLKSIYIPAALTSLSYPSFPDSSAMAQQLHVFFGGTRSAWEKVTSYSVGTTALSNVCLVAGYSFPWGNNYDWSFSTDATLTIGTMSGGGSRYAAPWAVYMPAVEKVVVKEGVKAIGYEAFAADAWSLTSVSLPDSLTLIALDAFNGCTALTEIALPGGVTEIQRNAFYGCKTLKRISIPAAVTAIGDDAFYNTALSDVYYGGTEEQWSAITIGSSNQRLTNAARHYNSPSF